MRGERFVMTSAFGRATAQLKLKNRHGAPALCGYLGLAGVAMALITDLVGLRVSDRDSLMDETISELAAGRHAWIQDLGFYCFALGLAAVAWALYRRGPESLRFQLGSGLLVAVAVCITVMGAHGEYGDGEPGGFVVHKYLLYAMGPLFGAATILLAPGLRSLFEKQGLARWSIGLGVLWLVSGPAVFFVPESWIGLYERGVALISLIWLGGVSILLIRGPETP